MPKAPRTSNSTPEIRALIYKKSKENIPVREIANFAGITRQAVYQIVKNYNARGHFNDAPRSGRPSKLDDRSLRHLKISLEGNRRQSLSDLTTTVNNILPAPVHFDTVRHALRHQLGMNARIAAKKPYLKYEHRRARLAWAKKHRRWKFRDWRRIIWTDECSVEIGKGSRPVWVYRRPGERYIEKCLTGTFKSGRQSLMMWGCMAHGRLGPLLRMGKGERSGVDYVNSVLSGPLWDLYMELSEKRGLVAVMEDGAPIHRAGIAKRFRDNHKMESLPHPAQSPDVNPIEHVWRMLKIRVNQRKERPKNLDELWKIIQEEWEKIDIGFVNSLVRGMPRRAKAVYEARGGPTKY